MFKQLLMQILDYVIHCPLQGVLELGDLYGCFQAKSSCDSVIVTDLLIVFY